MTTIDYINCFVVPKNHSDSISLNPQPPKSIKIPSTRKDINTFTNTIGMKNGDVLEIEVGNSLTKTTVDPKTMKNL
jgi:hypothetical protein